jgi:hypothetical protein
MSAYNQEFNKDNTILRYITVATLAELRNKVFYYNQTEEDLMTKIPVPFYYSITGNERFLADNFLYDAVADGKAIGDYEVVPRGILQLNSLAIDSGSQTNKFTRGEFVHEVEGQLKTFALNTNFLPLTMTFGVTVVCSNNLEMLKVTESIMTKLYKTTMYSVDLGMFRVEASMAVPEDYSQDRLFEFGLNDKKEFNVTFDLEVKSFMPVFENGILLTEVSEMARQSIAAGGSGGSGGGQGIGLFRTGPNGEIGIQFGGIFQKFEYMIEDIKKSPIEEAASNSGYVNPDSIKTGGPYIETTTDGAPIIPEADESKEYRNADGDEG